MSLRLVIPISRMLSSASTPSILVSSWLTTVSCTPAPAPEPALPRALQIASISSKMITCRSDSSPRASCSSSASLNRLRTFSSEAPTYLFRISGPLTTLGSRPLSILPIWRAISVLPVPGGPKSSTPRTCLIPRRATTAGGKTRDAKARRKICSNCASRPPMPSFSKLKSLALKSATPEVEAPPPPAPPTPRWPRRASEAPGATSKANADEAASIARGASAAPFPPGPGVASARTRKAKLTPWNSKVACCPTVKTCPAKRAQRCAPSSPASTSAAGGVPLGPGGLRETKSTSAWTRAAAKEAASRGGWNGTAVAVSPLERRRLRLWTALRARELRSTPGADWTERTLEGREGKEERDREKGEF